VALAEGDWEVVTFAPIERGVAVLGLADKLNSGGAIISRSWRWGSGLTLKLRDGGQLLCWAAVSPSRVHSDGMSVEWHYDRQSGRLDVQLPRGGERRVTLDW
jgi:raffinose synthase